MTDSISTAAAKVVASVVNADAEASSDDALVARVRAGDEAAFEFLFERHRRGVAKTALRFFHRGEQIEEVVQETFVKAYFAIDSYSGGHDKSFAAWLSRIATNAAYDELRRIKRQPSESATDLTDEELQSLAVQLRSATHAANVEQAFISRDLAEKLLARLEPEDRLVLTLLNGEEASVTDVAAVTGWSAAKVKVRAYRARGRLRKVLRKFL